MWEELDSTENYIVKVLMIITFIICAVVLIANDIYGSTHRCKVKGCERMKTEGSLYCKDHTCAKPSCKEIVCTDHYYCYEHQVIENEKIAARKAEEAKIPNCAVKGCTFKATDNKRYCIVHACKADKCRNRSIDESRYCEQHTCQGYNCYNQKETNEKYCKDCQARNARKKEAADAWRAEESKSKKSKKYVMPDCDDYEDFDEFMDEWEGRMPDGSNAEDYWDNW